MAENLRKMAKSLCVRTALPQLDGIGKAIASLKAPLVKGGRAASAAGGFPGITGVTVFFNFLQSVLFWKQAHKHKSIRRQSPGIPPTALRAATPL